VECVLAVHLHNNSVWWLGNTNFETGSNGQVLKNVELVLITSYCIMCITILSQVIVVIPAWSRAFKDSTELLPWSSTGVLKVSISWTS